jgi:DNA ligase-1
MNGNLIKDLERLSVFLEEMNASSSNNAKLATIKKYSADEFITKVFYYTFNPYKKYGVHTKVLKKHPELVLSKGAYDHLFQLLDDLAERNITGHAAIQAVNTFISSLPEDLHKLIYYILDRDLRMGASLTSILKIIPNIVPTFKVALAHPYHPSRVNFQTETWYGSRKLDGVRCICRKEGNTITFFSRNGKEFETLGNLENEILKIPGNFILDGEICIVDENGKEDFQGIMKEIRRKDHTIKNPKFLVFDYLSLEQFDTQGECSNNSKLSIRLSILDIVLSENKINTNFIESIPQIIIKDEEQFTEMVKEAEREGYEGIMLRNNISYEGTRSHNLLKVKKFYDAEYTVLKTVNGIIRWIENGVTVERETLSSIIIEHKGCLVSVGSGFSKDQRERYYNNPSDLIGKTVTIQYFEESTNVNGGYSLRFPVIKHIYENGRDC